VWPPLVSLTVRTMASPPPPRRTQSCHHAALTFIVYKRSTPPPVSSPFPPLPLRHHYAVVPPSLSHCEMPPWSLSEPPVTTLSSALTPGAPSTSVSVPSAASLLHHRRSPPLGLHRRGTRHSGEPSPLFGRQTGPSPAGLLSGHSTVAHRSPADRISPASHQCRRGRRPPQFHLGPKG
jgi:hypothetical protein